MQLMRAKRTHARTRSRGFNLLEVLVAMLIIMVGLLGLAGLQARAQVAELESYQRAQALVLLYDMVDRINNNKLTAPCFVITTSTTAGTPYVGATSGGSHYGTPSCGVSTTQNNTMANNAITAWDGLLQGAAELKGAGANQVGAMIDARGCISYNTATEYVDAVSGANIAGTGEYTIAVSWQGMADTFAPTAACGANLYGSETKRRTVWVTMRVGTLKAQ
jgi:type IV pilus assembly protein PilV